MPQTVFLSTYERSTQAKNKAVRKAGEGVHPHP